jgi:hypothetical protein
MFPAGAPGCGLLLLRLIAAISVHFDSSGHLAQNSSVAVFAALLTLSILLIAGLLAPLAAAFGGTAQLLLLITSGTSLPVEAALGVLHSFAVVLLGPGAYSVDARLFGRRLLILHSRDNDRDAD